VFWKVEETCQPPSQLAELFTLPGCIILSDLDLLFANTAVLISPGMLRLELVGMVGSGSIVL
jgi:hypothetical protein